jgi:hypothetical protein
MKLKVDDQGVIFGLVDGSTLEVCDGGFRSIEGFAGELEDGQTFTCSDGGTVTRHGAEEIWFSPPPRTATP